MRLLLTGCNVALRAQGHLDGYSKTLYSDLANLTGEAYTAVGSHQRGPYIICVSVIIMEICNAPTLLLKALNKHTHIMYIEMENVIKEKKSKKIDKGF